MYICLVTVYTNIKIKGSELIILHAPERKHKGPEFKKNNGKKKKKKSPQYDR